jgi:hypothetical protein
MGMKLKSLWMKFKAAIFYESGLVRRFPWMGR